MNQLESLESRKLFAVGPAVTATFVIVQSTDGTVFEVSQDAIPAISRTGTLYIPGGRGNDVISVTRRGSNIDVSMPSFEHPLRFSYPFDEVRRILIDTKDGNDRVGVAINISRRCTLAGGAGHDVLVGSPGDTIIGGGGNDKLVAQQFQPTVDANGDLVFRPAPEGGAVLTGGNGNDTLVASGDDTVVGGAGHDLAINEHYVAPGTIDSALVEQLFGSRASTIEEFFLFTRYANNLNPFLPVT